MAPHRTGTPLSFRRRQSYSHLCPLYSRLSSPLERYSDALEFNNRLTDWTNYENIPSRRRGVQLRRKRTCLINGGFSHICDYKEIIDALNNRDHWDSEESPGRKKRSIETVLISNKRLEDLLNYMRKGKGHRNITTPPSSNRRNPQSKLLI
ncbi:uncharacterized protein LOC136036471 isoform X2 [Artemia franciscana]|uniref:uncharacterized protein LOC136036471 isoform X2 n=1 Tax=Artemia franciscana TaxID=6661 RepID=UPI0032DAC353